MHNSGLHADTGRPSPGYRPTVYQHVGDGTGGDEPQVGVFKVSSAQTSQAIARGRVASCSQPTAGRRIEVPDHALRFRRAAVQPVLVS
jgi:hypothetical protein